jgi:hypothetical protein
MLARSAEGLDWILPEGNENATRKVRGQRRNVQKDATFVVD